MKTPFKTVAALIIITPFLASCGTTTSDRATSGGLMGVAGGAALMAVTGGPILAGAAVGAAAGAVAGAITDSNQVNLDKHHKHHHQSDN